MTHARLIVSPAIGTFRHAERSFRGKILAMEYYTTLWTDMNYFIGSKFFSVFFFIVCQFLSNLKNFIYTFEVKDCFAWLGFANLNSRWFK